MGIRLSFTEEDWERVQRAWTTWWAGELDRPLVVIESQNAHPPWEWSRDFLLETPVDAVLDYYQARLKATCFFGDA